MPKQIYHEVNVADLGDTLSEINESLFKMYIQIATFAGHKIMGLISGPELAKLLVNLPGDSQKELKDHPFYKMGHHGVIPIFVDASLGENDVIVVCKGGIEKIRVSYERQATDAARQGGHQADAPVPEQEVDGNVPSSSVGEE